MKRLFAYLIFTIVGIPIFAQNIQLTQKQMYDDFDQLRKIIEECNPQIDVRKIVTGFHQLDTIKSLRKNIDTISCYENFRKLLNLALFYCFDIHTNETYEYYPFDNLKNIDTVEITKRKNYYHSQEYVQEKRQEIIANQCKLVNFPISPIYNYEDDNYYLLGQNKIIKYDKSDTIFIECMRIISYNYKPFGKYVEENCKRDFRYDYLRQKYYYGGEYYTFIPGIGKLKGEQYDKIIEFDIEDYPERRLNDEISRKDIDIIFHEIPEKTTVTESFGEKKKVDFFEKDSILFIYIDKMIIDTSFCNKIKEVGRNKKINKIVIDIRDNGGGNELCWHKVLSTIVKDTITYHLKLAANNTEMLKEKFQGFHYPNEYETIEWLNNKEFMIFDYSYLIVPDNNSLNYDGKIYVLSNKNTYSAAYSLVNFAKQIDQFVSVGYPTGQIEGFGITPQLFQLKNSTFTFRMPCVIDIFACNKPIDVYQDFPEILVFPNSEEEMIFSRTKYDRKSEQYLRKYDSMFKKVASLKE
jgi:hypothetical protein